MKNSIGAFTLLELMIIIMIVSFISVASYAPYAHHQKKLLLRQATREVAQSLSEAHNLAIHGMLSGSGNVHTALRFASGAIHLEYYTYTGALRNTYNAGSMELLKEKPLPKGVQIKHINSISQDLFISYAAISGRSDNSLSSTGAIDIVLAYKGTDSPVLQKTLRYYPTSFISDY